MGTIVAHSSANQADSRSSTSLNRQTVDDPVSVAVLVGSKLAEDCLLRVLKTFASVRPLAGAEACRADVVLVLATDLDEATLEQMSQIAAESQVAWKPIVLVCERIGEQQILKGMDSGLVSIVFWSEATLDNLIEVILSSRKGHSAMPHELVGLLMRRMRLMRAAASPSAQVTVREIDVIRLLGDGLGTLEIATKMNFSERTIKNIIAGLCTRFSLQNRTHLVAFAFRNGII